MKWDRPTDTKEVQKMCGSYFSNTLLQKKKEYLISNGNEQFSRQPNLPKSGKLLL